MRLRRHRLGRSRSIGIKRRAVGRPVVRVKQRGERHTGRAPLFLAREQMVVATVDRAQSEREIVRGDQSPRPVKPLACGVGFGNLDLIKYEVDVAADIRYHAYTPDRTSVAKVKMGSVSVELGGR